MMFKDLRNLFVLIFSSVYAIAAMPIYVILALLDYFFGKIADFVGYVRSFYGVNVIKIADRIANLKK